MTELLLLPTPDVLAVEADPSARLLALVEPATELLMKATRVDEVHQIRGQAAALERYARVVRLSAEAIGAAQTVCRRAEVRLGELAGPHPGRPGPPPKSERGDSQPDGLSDQARWAFRRLATNAPVVEQVVAELAPEGKATQTAVLERIKRTDGKRRCEGCSKVITGRPNKLYCSAACKLRAQRRRKKVSNERYRSGPVPSVIKGTNGVLIAAVARLGYLGGADDLVLDVTYGRGKWWTRYRPPNLIARLDCDFRHLPEVDDCVQVVCFDPPYISTGNRDTSSVDDFYTRYGLGDLNGWRAVRELMSEGLCECARILAPGGYLLVKCMDYVESGHKVWNTLHMMMLGEAIGLRLVDRFIHLSGGGPQTTTNLDGSPRQQKHAREVSSMLLVFTKEKAK